MENFIRVSQISLRKHMRWWIKLGLEQNIPFETIEQNNRLIIMIMTLVYVLLEVELLAEFLLMLVNMQRSFTLRLTMKSLEKK